MSIDRPAPVAPIQKLENRGQREPVAFLVARPRPMDPVPDVISPGPKGDGPGASVAEIELMLVVWREHRSVRELVVAGRPRLVHPRGGAEQEDGSCMPSGQPFVSGTRVGSAILTSTAR